MSSQSQSIPAKVFRSSLKLIATNYAYRCDAKYADDEILASLARVETAGKFHLGTYLPRPFVKGIQPEYLDHPTDDSVPVISTLAIQKLEINGSDCRHIARDDYESLSVDRQLKSGDVLLTVDGGVSIGKPCLFNLSEPYTMDSHVVALRPQGLSPLALVYLLASPLGQVQFRRAESGASGQTTVTEDDIRRFIFPLSALKTIEKDAGYIEAERLKIRAARAKLFEKEVALWSSLKGLS